MGGKIMTKFMKRITAVMLSAAEVLTVCAFGTPAAAASTEMNPNTIAAGESHSLVIKKDMSLWAAGDNSMGQLGVEDVESSEGVKVMEKVVFVDANDDVSFAIDINGTLYGWGDNSKGQVAPNKIDYFITKPLKIMENVVAVSAGDTHTVAITADGTAYGWGSNEYGELGKESNNSKNSVTELKKNVVDVAAGDGFTMMVTADGALYACGNNAAGQLGYGSRFDQETPVLSMASGVVDVEVGNEHTVILKSDGTVWTSGSNDRGQLGNKSDSNSTSFVSANLTNIAKVFAGGNSSGAVNKSGSLYTWGSNEEGQLHNGKNVDLNLPASVTTGIVSIAFAEHHSVMLKTNSSVSTVGAGTAGELFSSSSSGSVTKPVKVKDNIICYSAGTDHAAAIDEKGVLYTWGKNDCGQLGLGDTNSRKSPTKVPIKDTAEKVWCGDKVTFVLCSNDVYVFGNNSGNMLGMTTKTTNVLTPTINDNLTAISNLEIYPSDGFCLALISGTVYGWGKNSAGRLLSLPSNVKQPEVITDELGSVSKLAVGNNHVLALSGGTVYGWGANSVYQLGTTGISIVDPPIEVEFELGNDNVVNSFSDIAAGGNHSLLIDYEGKVWAVGENADGQLGTDTFRLRNAYNAAYDASSVESGDTACAVIYSTGKLSLCGNNTYGALGNGTVKDVNKFGTVTATSAQSVSIGEGFGGYIDYNDTLFCWGDNSFGQVGNGKSGARVTPEVVIKDALCSALKKAESITLDKTAITIKPMMTEKLTATTKPENAFGVSVFWSSSDTKVALVSADGIVTGVAAGKATITAKTGDLTATCEVTVDIPVTSFSVSPSKSKTLNIGKTFTFKTKVYPSNAVDKTLLFSSSDEKVAKVDQNGKVTALSSGKSVITITSKSNPAKSVSVTIKVRPAKAVVTSKKATKSGVVLKWKDAEGADGYDVFRKLSGSSASAKVIGTIYDENTFTDSTAKNGKTYIYSVRAYKVIDGKKVYSSSYTQYKIKAKTQS